jgi:hypothetical protein
MDNNVVASSRFKEIIAEIRDLGFQKGAKLDRGNGRPPVQRRVDFNQGVDARILCKSPMFLRELASICTDPLRIAFDHWGLKQQYEQSVRYAHDFELDSLSNYMLYNFKDTPEDLHRRMWLNIQLNEELNIRIFSFPMRYQPTDMKERTYVGPHWNKYYLRSLQLILHATHGIVSGAPSFFRRALGSTPQEFVQLLSKPHKFIFNRDWFEELNGVPELEEYTSEFAGLSNTDQNDLLAALVQFDKNTSYEAARGTITNSTVRRIFRFYKPLDKDQEAEIWRKQAELRKDRLPECVLVPDEKRVEDADLDIDAVLEKT